MADALPTPSAERTVLSLSGSDREKFLQGLVTNDIRKLAEGPIHAALLTPQGKYLADFFLVPDGERILMDVARSLADDLLKRLMLYRLRADVAIEPTDLVVARGLGPAPEGAFADPRAKALGWRMIGPTDALPPPETVNWDALRVEHMIPESGIELQPNESYILEWGFERMGSVDFRKGCYVGQEVTARMKHKTELRKGMARVEIDGTAMPGTEITAEGRPVGRLFTVSGNRALAHLRYDRAGGEMRAGEAVIRWDGTRGI